MLPIRGKSGLIAAIQIQELRRQFLINPAICTTSLRQTDRKCASRNAAHDKFGSLKKRCATESDAPPTILIKQHPSHSNPYLSPSCIKSESFNPNLTQPTSITRHVLPLPRPPQERQGAAGSTHFRSLFSWSRNNLVVPIGNRLLV
jgi:hypothetical protein